MQAHELAKLFPEIPKEEFAQIVADIKEHGQLEPIWTYEDKVLDGWHRYQAVIAAGKEPKTREWKGDDPVAFVRSMNLRRRHLGAYERGIVDAKTRAIDGTKHGDGRKPTAEQQVQSSSERAGSLDIGASTIHDADAMVAHAPEAADAVLAGTMQPKAALNLARRAAKAKTEPQRQAIVERGIAAAKKPKAPRGKSSKKKPVPKSHAATAEVKWLIEYLKAWKSVLEKDALVALEQSKFSPEAAAFFARRLRETFEPVAKEFETWASKHGRRK